MARSGREASACRWVSSPRPSTSSKSRAIPRTLAPLPGASCWSCPASPCALPPPAPSKRIASSRSPALTPTRAIRSIWAPCSWPRVLPSRCSVGRCALVLAAGFTVVYIPVIAGEEQFLRATFPGFDDYCRRVPRLIPRLTPAQAQNGQATLPGVPSPPTLPPAASHSPSTSSIASTMLQ